MEFPGSLVVRLHASMARGLGLIPGWGTNIPQGGVAKKKKNFFSNFSSENTEFEHLCSVIRYTILNYRINDSMASYFRITRRDML